MKNVPTKLPRPAQSGRLIPHPPAHGRGLEKTREVRQRDHEGPR